MTLSIFSYACCPSVYLLWWGVCSDLLPIFLLRCLFSYCWVLSIYWIQIFITYYFAYIFSQSVACLFLLLILPLTEQKLFNFNEVLRTNFFFRGSCIWSLYLKTHSHTQAHPDFLLLSWSFIGLCFGSMIFLGLSPILVNFCEGCKVLA